MSAEFVGHDSRNLVVAMLAIWVLLGVVACLLYTLTFGRWLQEESERRAEGEACLQRADALRDLRRVTRVDGEMWTYEDCAQEWEKRAREQFGVERMRRANHHSDSPPQPPVEGPIANTARPWQA